MRLRKSISGSGHSSNSNSGSNSSSSSSSSNGGDNSTTVIVIYNDKKALYLVFDCMSSRLLNVAWVNTQPLVQLSG